MTEPQAGTPGQAPGRRALVLLIPIVLIGSFLWRVLIPAHEYAMRTEQVMTIVFDIGMLVGLISLKNSFPKPLFWIAVVAGVGLLAIRMTSNASWWTGHLIF